MKNRALVSIFYSSGRLGQERERVCKLTAVAPIEQRCYSCQLQEYVTVHCGSQSHWPLYTTQGTRIKKVVSKSVRERESGKLRKMCVCMWKRVRLTIWWGCRGHCGLDYGRTIEAGWLSFAHSSASSGRQSWCAAPNRRFMSDWRVLSWRPLVYPAIFSSCLAVHRLWAGTLHHLPPPNGHTWLQHLMPPSESACWWCQSGIHCMTVSLHIYTVYACLNELHTLATQCCCFPAHLCPFIFSSIYSFNKLYYISLMPRCKLPATGCASIFVLQR